MSKRRIIFRADGNSQIGLGHVVRSLALANMLKDDFTCVFAIQVPSEAIKGEIQAICDQIFILPFADNYLNEANYLINQIINVDDIVVLDSYFFDTDYQRIIKNNGNKLVCIDDLHACHFVADVVINHSPGYSPEVYSSENYTQFLLGTDYALLRKPFLESASIKKNKRNNHSIFVSFGGSDIYHYTERIAHRCLSIACISHIHAVLGISANITGITKQYKHQKDKISFYTQLTAYNICAIMEQSQIAICPASSLVLETCATGLDVLSGYYALNQFYPYESMVKLGYIYPLGDFRTLSDDNLIKAINEVFAYKVVLNSRDLIDGKQKMRYQKAFHNLTYGE